VKEQTSAYLDKARELLDNADAILRIDLYEAAGRTAYLAGFHAAQAFIFETSGRIYKTHSGVHGEFSRLVKDDPRVDDQLRAFLGQAYTLNPENGWRLSVIPIPHRQRLSDALTSRQAWRSVKKPWQ